MQTILIYCNQITNRLKYVLDWIFREQLFIDYRVTYNKEEFLAAEGMKLNYSTARLSADDLFIIPHKIMWEQGEIAQQLNVNRWKKSMIIFYNQPGALIPFDIFAATFYFITRYEEYLPHKKDKHGRYSYQSSLAHEYAFLQQPVVDEWIFNFKKIIEKKFKIILPQRKFEFQPTYDIDIAYAYRYKPRKQNWGGAIKDFFKLRFGWVFSRLIVTNSKKVDPYDAYSWMNDLHKFFNLHPIYFFLVGKPGSYDRNLDPKSPGMMELIKQTVAQYAVGLHPSYNSLNQLKVIKSELDILEEIGERVITRSRQHYIRMTMPETYRKLIEANIEEDYSMGYPDINGFRASTTQPFLWYDLSREQKTNLRVHPFCFMETTAINAYKSDKKEAYLEIERLLHVVKMVEGRFVTIFHNNNLGSGRENKGWHKVYRKLIEKAQALV